MLRSISKYLGLPAVVIVAACSAHNPMNVAGKTQVIPASSGKTYPPTTNQIRMTERNLPQGTYEVIGKIDVGSVWYGDLSRSEKALANRARAMGADAVIEMKLWHQPEGWSWAAPQGSGIAVKLTDPGSVDLNAVPGDWY